MKRTLVTRSRAVALALVLAAGTAGCSANSPFQTAQTQSLADGVAVDLESAHVRNLALVSGEKGGDATVTGAVENLTNKELTITVSVQGSKVSAKVPARGVVNLSEDTKLTLKQVDAAPGDMTDVEISDGKDSTPLGVPVLDPTGYYEDYAPDGWTPTPTPSESGQSGESESD